MADKLTKRTQQALETKKRIQESAMALFQKNDLEDVTIAEICKAANVSAGHFYNYFDSKEALVMAAYPAFDKFVKEEFVRKQYQSGLEAIKAIIYYQSRVVADLGPSLFAQIMRLQLRLTGQYVIESSRYYNSHMRELVKRCLENGELRADLDANEVADMILRQARGVMFDWGLRGGPYILEDRVQEDLQFMLRGLTATH